MIYLDRAIKDGFRSVFHASPHYRVCGKDDEAGARLGRA